MFWTWPIWHSRRLELARWLQDNPDSNDDIRHTTI
jgi:hypothetical protein